MCVCMYVCILYFFFFFSLSYASLSATIFKERKIGAYLHPGVEYNDSQILTFHSNDSNNNNNDE